MYESTKALVVRKTTDGVDVIPGDIVRPCKALGGVWFAPFGDTSRTGYADYSEIHTRKPIPLSMGDI